MQESKNNSGGALRPRGLLSAFSFAFLVGVLLCLPPGWKARANGLLRLITDPAQTFTAMLQRAARGAWGGLPDGTTRETADSLRNDLAEAKNKLADTQLRSQTLEQENRILRNRLGLSLGNPSLSLSVCEVLRRDPFQSYYDYIIIGRGTSDGVRPGCHILTEAGLVGVVSEASPRTAKVTLLTSASYASQCFVPTRGVTGVLVGTGVRGSGLQMLQPIPGIVVNSLDGVLFDRVQTGDFVTVNATGVPDGSTIVAGTVERIEPNVAGAPTLHLTPAVNFAQLRYVFAVIGNERL
ncbi:MAG: rod shape-determining protein MreC [Victivallales bacterium]|nr:rod shape-determining protein MreC [Victivallales bacterium]